MLIPSNSSAGLVKRPARLTSTSPWAKLDTVVQYFQEASFFLLEVYELRGMLGPEASSPGYLSRNLAFFLLPLPNGPNPPYSSIKISSLDTLHQHISQSTITGCDSTSGIKYASS